MQILLELQYHNANSGIQLKYIYIYTPKKKTTGIIFPYGGSSWPLLPTPSHLGAVQDVKQVIGRMPGAKLAYAGIYTNVNTQAGTHNILYIYTYIPVCTYTHTYICIYNLYTCVV